MAGRLEQFMEAARSSDVSTLEMRLREDRSLAVAVDENGETALHKAAKNGNVPVAEKLIRVDKSCLEMSSRKEGFTAVHFAVDNGHPNMLVTLLNHNADRDPVSKEVQDQCTPLHIAAKKGNVTCVKTLVAANCCLNKQNKVQL